MPSHKQKRDRKRSHKHKHRNRSRSTLRRHTIQKKNEGKKENIPHNTTTWKVDLGDISSYIENRREMIRQMFSSIGEDFLTERVPLILKQATREELKRICFEELTKMSADVVFKVLEGIPYDKEPNTSQDETSMKRDYDYNSSCGHTSRNSPMEECCRIIKDSKEQELDVSKREDEELSCDERSQSVESSSSEERHTDSEKDESRSLEDDIYNIRNEAPSTSYQPSVTKKLAKVAPFLISIPKSEIPQAAQLDEEEEYQSTEIDNETTYEMIDLGLEEDIGDGENDSDSLGEGTMDEVPTLVHGENSDGQEMTEDEVQQNFSEMLELEHRARAIRSMLANIDQLQA